MLVGLNGARWVVGWVASKEPDTNGIARASRSVLSSRIDIFQLCCRLPVEHLGRQP